MKFNLFVLKKSEKLGLDNSNFNIIDFQDKLREEFKEAMVEADLVRVYRNSNLNKARKHKINLAGEILDIIQVCIAGLVMLAKDGVNLHVANIKHTLKLVEDREWSTSKHIKIEVLDNDRDS